MAKRITVNNFAKGITDDRFGGTPSEFSFAKHFDILTHPRRLQPLRGMTAESVTDSKIGNIIVAHDGLMYGVGENPANPGSSSRLWQRSGYGASDVWQRFASNDQLGSGVYNADLLVDFPDCGNVKSIFWANANQLCASDPADSTTATLQSLSFSSIGQGLVHPKNRVLYFPYKTSSAHYIGSISSNGTPFSGLSSTAFSLPFFYRAYCLSFYGGYLAIPLTSPNGIGVNGSVVALWSKDTNITTPEETIPWGAGSLQVLNNLQGVLIGVNSLSANYTGSFQDYDAIQVKIWAGGAEPTLVKEIKAIHLAGSSHPSVTINPRVNFIHNNRLYFSVNIVPNDGKQAAWYGLWSVGKNKLTGEWTVLLERVATNDNSETGVLAAAIAGDFVSMCHTTEGTLTYTLNGQTSNTTFGATSVYESLVNHGMADDDRIGKKKLLSAFVRFLPLPTSGQIVLKYRVDSDGDTTDWATVRTFTTADAVNFEMSALSTGTQFTDGYNYEFRIESTGGATPIAWGYKYEVIPSNV